MMFERKFSKEDIKHLPLYKYDGQIHLLDQTEKLHQLADRILPGDVIGFDTESKPTFKKGQYHPVSLIQMALGDDVYLIRNLLTGMRPVLERILSDDTIIKVGCGLRDDLRDLHRWHPMRLQGFLDLNTLVLEAGYDCQGVRRLAAQVLRRRISKSQQVSNWERSELTPAQQVYAATDAWVCREIYLTLVQEGILSKSA